MNKMWYLWAGLLVVLVGAVVLVAVFVFGWPSAEAYTPPITDADGNVLPGSIASIETVVLGGVPQTIVMRGVDRSKPVLLHLHGGPGMPSSVWATWNGYFAGLEEHFVLVHWDQRGAGKSYSPDLTANDMHMENFVSDTLELTDLLRERFDQDKIFLWGHSFGSGVGFETLRVNAEPYHAFFASAVRPEWNTSQELGYELLLQLVQEAGDAKSVKALTELQPFDATNPEHLGVKGQIQSQYLAGDFHTEGLEQAWLDYGIKGKSPEYPKSTVKNTMAGLTFSKETVGQEAIHSGYDHARDLPASEIPVFFFAGRYDYVSPGESAHEYYEVLEAPAKEFIWFENSAHDVFYDEPEGFSQEVVRLAEQVLNP